MTREDVLSTKVTPHAGVWIEISGPTRWTAPARSLPTRECGLKYKALAIAQIPGHVTPHAGVWIEIDADNNQIFLRTSLPTRECGLKYAFEAVYVGKFWSLPTRECGLK